jgi:hypothetical protein
MRDAEVRCGSWLVYATRGRSAAAAFVRYLILCLKRGGVEPVSGRLWADLLVEALGARAPEHLRRLFSSPVTLVPVPRAVSSSWQSADAAPVWPAAVFCHALRRSGLGDDVQTLLRRVVSVPKSAWHRGDRPGVDVHYESFEVQLVPAARRPERVLLVDDVVARGATIMGATRRLRNAFPGMAIDAFALARVQGTGDISQAVQPAIEYVASTARGYVRLPASLPIRARRMASASRGAMQKVPTRQSGVR